MRRCPDCQMSYNASRWDACPHCGAGKAMATSGVVKTSTILIAAGGEDGSIYHSKDEVPERLRRMLEKSTTGVNSGTIFIADQRGRDEIAKAIRNLPQGLPRAGTAGGILAPKALGKQRRARSLISTPALWCGVAVGAVTGFLAWLVWSHVW